MFRRQSVVETLRDATKTIRIWGTPKRIAGYLSIKRIFSSKSFDGIAKLTLKLWYMRLKPRAQSNCRFLFIAYDFSHTYTIFNLSNFKILKIAKYTYYVFVFYSMERLNYL